METCDLCQGWAGLLSGQAATAGARRAGSTRSGGTSSPSRLTRTPSLSGIIRQSLLAPRSDSDADVEAFVRETLTQGFHGMGSCVMGKMGSERVVDKDFRVLGTQGLRVADMSVCPILTCNHTQINAYLIGIRCADLLVEEALKMTRARL